MHGDRVLCTSTRATFAWIMLGAVTITWQECIAPEKNAELSEVLVFHDASINDSKQSITLSSHARRAQRRSKDASCCLPTSYQCRDSLHLDPSVQIKATACSQIHQHTFGGEVKGRGQAACVVTPVHCLLPACNNGAISRPIKNIRYLYLQSLCYHKLL